MSANTTEDSRMIQLTPEQSHAMASESDSPVLARDPQTETTYVLVPMEAYANGNRDPSGDEDFVADVQSHVMEVLGREGWNDPSMDIYNDLDPRKP